MFTYLLALSRESQERSEPGAVELGSRCELDGPLLQVSTAGSPGAVFVIIIIDNFCLALFFGVHKLTALYNILQHFLSFTNIIHIIMTTNNV